MGGGFPGGGYPGGGFPGGGGPPGGYDPLASFRNEIGRMQAEFDRRHNEIAGHLRNRDKVLQNAGQKLSEIAGAVEALKATRAGADETPGIVRIENIPGRRVPFTLLVDIPIGANTTSTQQGSITISQEGPFVAVKRMATFQSALEFQVAAENGQLSRFSGRSFGRFRPIHSAWDLNDSQNNATVDVGILFALIAGGGGGGAVGIPGMVPAWTSSMSQFRTMEFDGRIIMINAGSSYPRQNIAVPTTFWTDEINSPSDLGCLDFFERGEVLTLQVSPTHVNNPPAGNADGPNFWPTLGVIGSGGGVGGWPFLQGQYDPHEGIVTPQPLTFGQPTTAIETDPITRLPDGIITLGWEGYRIIQPVAP